MFLLPTHQCLLPISYLLVFFLLFLPTQPCTSLLSIVRLPKLYTSNTVNSLAADQHFKYPIRTNQIAIYLHFTMSAYHKQFNGSYSLLPTTNWSIKTDDNYFSSINNIYFTNNIPAIHSFYRW
jgi:hypothetical protein